MNIIESGPIYCGDAISTCDSNGKFPLDTISKETSLEEVRDLDLVGRIKDACRTAWTDACGLAAIQIGVPLRFAWFMYEGKEYTLLNPKIVKGNNLKHKREGCLSIPGKWFDVRRYTKIKYESDGEVKTAKYFVAQVIQHEIDHMDGKLISSYGRLLPK